MKRVFTFEYVVELPDGLTVTERWDAEDTLIENIEAIAQAAGFEKPTFVDSYTLEVKV